MSFFHSSFHNTGLRHSTCRMPTCFSSGSVSSSRLFVSGSDLLLQGFAVRVLGLAVAFHHVAGHGCGSSSSSGYLNFFLLPGRLAGCGELPGPPYVPSAFHFGGLF